MLWMWGNVGWGMKKRKSECWARMKEIEKPISLPKKSQFKECLLLNIKHICIFLAWLCMRGKRSGSPRGIQTEYPLNCLIVYLRERKSGGVKRGRKKEWRGEEGQRRESKLHTQCPMWDSISWPSDHGLSWYQELEVQLAEPPSFSLLINKMG